MFPISDSVPRRSAPFMIWTLIALNGIVFFLEVNLPPARAEWLIYHYGLVPARYSDPAWALSVGLNPSDWLPFISNTFLHGGWMHLIGNMWTLWLFGSAVEDRMGPVRFAVFYLVCGLLASATHFIFNLSSTVPAIGASGAVSGVMGAYALMFPRARIVFMVPIFFLPYYFEMHAMVYAVGWFVWQFLQGTGGLLAPELGGGIAWWAHIGGFVAGVALIHLFRLPRRRYRPYFHDEGIWGFGPSGERA